MRRPARGDEVVRGVEVFRLAGRAVHLHEADLDFLVPRHLLPSIRTERRRNEIRIPDRDVEQRALAGRLKMRDGRLVEMSGVVQLVAAVFVRPALRTEARRGVRRIDRARRHQVSILLLRLGDQLDQRVHTRRKIRVGHERQRVRRRLDDLVDVRVVEAAAFVLARLLPCRLFEVRDAAGRVVLLQNVGNRDRAVDLDLRRPELVVDRHGRRRHRANRVVVRRCGRCRSQRGKNC
jgi:hypothetical protein